MDANFILRLHQYNELTYNLDGIVGASQNISTESDSRKPLYLAMILTIIYVAIFCVGFIGNMMTCVVIVKNKTLHTVTNCYLFNLTVGNLLLLMYGMPLELNGIWTRTPVGFRTIDCIQYLVVEVTTNVSILTITATTVERYVAICHPFLSRTMSKFSRAVKIIGMIWLIHLAVITYGAIYFRRDLLTLMRTAEAGELRNPIHEVNVSQVFSNLIGYLNIYVLICTILLYVVPLAIILVLNVLIFRALRRSGRWVSSSRNNVNSTRGNHSSVDRTVIRMLVAVVVAFSIFWAPYHAYRLLSVSVNQKYIGRIFESLPHDVRNAMTILWISSNVLLYLSTVVNPLLYNVMCKKFQEAFLASVPKCCIPDRFGDLNYGSDEIKPVTTSRHKG